jgi:hypothetical protein
MRAYDVTPRVLLHRKVKALDAPAQPEANMLDQCSSPFPMTSQRLLTALLQPLVVVATSLPAGLTAAPRNRPNLPKTCNADCDFWITCLKVLYVNNSGKPLSCIDPTQSTNYNINICYDWATCDLSKSEGLLRSDLPATISWICAPDITPVDPTPPSDILKSPEHNPNCMSYNVKVADFTSNILHMSPCTKAIGSGIALGTSFGQTDAAAYVDATPAHVVHPVVAARIKSPFLRFLRANRSAT